MAIRTLGVAVFLAVSTREARAEEAVDLEAMTRIRDEGFHHSRPAP